MKIEKKIIIEYSHTNNNFAVVASIKIYILVLVAM